MQRDLQHIARSDFDIVVVGGGIYGAWTALDAAQRGLSVVLVEQNDFCSATSANHHKIIHGGLRYLQHGDIRRMRESIRERSALLRIAPDLVRPLPVLVHTTSRWSQHRLTMGAALLANELLSVGRNRGLFDGHRLPPGQLLGLSACAHFAPAPPERATGGALFHDAQVLSPERLIITILQQAHEEGASLANYVRAAGYIRQGDRVAGVRAVCTLSEEQFDIRARTVINCVGPWAGEQLQLLTPQRREDLRVFKAAVLVARDLGLKAALAVPGRAAYKDSSEVLRKNYRNYFITPWRGLSLIGTFYAPHDGSAGACTASEQEIGSWIEEINAAWPAAGLRRDDVYRALTGLLPRDPGSLDDEPQYAKRHRIMDHGQDNGVHGLLTVVGVKFTTARAVAERAVDAAAALLGRRRTACRTARTLLRPQAPLIHDARLAASALYTDSSALRQAVCRAVRTEMARRLADVVLRRTDLASAGPPSEACLAQCAAIMEHELGWGSRDRESAQSAVQQLCERKGVGHAA